MWKSSRGVLVGGLMLASAGTAQAALVGVTQSFPDITLVASPYVIYDHDGVNATTGRLIVVSGGSTLNEGPSAGNSAATQSYFGAGDSVPNLALTINVNNITGALVDGGITIGFGNSATVPRFSWTGAITSFGSAVGTGTIFDATWSVSADSYQLMPSTLSQFVNGFLTGGAGGLKITSSGAWGVNTTFGNDWILGNGLTTTIPGSLASFTGGLTAPVLVNSSITSDIWAAPAPVPLPAAAWLLLSGLGLLAPAARRRAVAA